MADEILSDYIREKALAAQLNKSVRTLERWRRERIGPPVTLIGGTCWYRVKTVIRWLQDQEQKPLKPLRTSRRRR